MYNGRKARLGGRKLFIHNTLSSCYWTRWIKFRCAYWQARILYGDCNCTSMTVDHSYIFAAPHPKVMLVPSLSNLKFRANCIQMLKQVYTALYRAIYW